MANHSITITDEKFYNQILEYCKENNEKVNVFCTRLLKKSLAMEQYGDVPFLKFEENKQDIRHNSQSNNLTVNEVDSHTDNGPVSVTLPLYCDSTNESSGICDKEKEVEKFVSEFNKHKDEKPLGEMTHPNTELKIENTQRPKKRRL